ERLIRFLPCIAFREPAALAYLNRRARREQASPGLVNLLGLGSRAQATGVPNPARVRGLGRGARAAGERAGRQGGREAAPVVMAAGGRGRAGEGPGRSGRGGWGRGGSGPVRPGPVRWGPVRSGPVRSGPVRSVPVRQ